jgi:hypothetical protein
LLRSQADSDHNAFQIPHHIVIGEPEHAISAGSKPFIASAIVAETGFEIVALAIDLNDELAGMRNKVRDVIAHGALPAKSERDQPMRLQMAPQQHFGARHCPS